MDLIAAFGCFLILMGLGYPIATYWYEYLPDFIFFCCVALELFGLQTKNYRIILFGLVYRCISLILYFLGFIGVIVLGHLYQSETITEPEFVELMDQPAW